MKQFYCFSYITKNETYYGYVIISLLSLYILARIPKIFSGVGERCGWIIVFAMGVRCLFSINLLYEFNSFEVFGGGVPIRACNDNFISDHWWKYHLKNIKNFPIQILTHAKFSIQLNCLFFCRSTDLRTAHHILDDNCIFPATCNGRSITILSTYDIWKLRWGCFD